MSKAAKHSILILIVLLVASLGYAGYTTFEKQKVEKAKLTLEGELKKTQSKSKKQAGQIKTLKGDLGKAQTEKQDLSKKLVESDRKASELGTQVKEVTEDRDKWKRRIDNLKRDRDQLMVRVETMKSQVAALSKSKKEEEDEEADPFDEPEKSAQPTFTRTGSRTTAPVTGTTSDEEYWASVLKQKAALEVQLEAIKQDLAKSSVDLLDVQQKNADMKVELEAYKHDKEDIEREIRYKESMINNLSLELARTRNDKKFVEERVIKVNEENSEMRKELKKLIVAKGSLEKSIVRLSEQKNKIEKKLGQSESLIQSKIDEIWEIKKSLDDAIKETRDTGIADNEVELPPIVVSSGGSVVDFDSGQSYPGYDGKVISMNEDNNFIIVNLGKGSGLQLGEVLSVYRDSKYIARLEVIQVRKDISAADIKEQWSKIKVGDVVR